ncbi:MAG: proline dehydrogenase family protein [Acidobacteriia bacterium]|nr:proline dehydrogenase family protein [Terriglobia bacterium]
MLRALFIWLSESRSLRGFAERSSAGQRMSQRFVAGTQVDDALRATKAVNDLGASVSIDNLGENVTSSEEAKQSAALYHQLLDLISERKLNANVSVKLTHMGLDMDEKLAYDNVTSLVQHAATLGSFVRVDMEGSPYTQRTLDFVHRLHRDPANDDAVGAVIQSYMRRSQSDVKTLLAERIRIRLCKGAYKEPPEVAFQKKSEVDASYVRLMKILLQSGTYHGIATHDENIIRQTIAFARSESIPPASFEFQMLHGIRRDLQQGLVKDGWRMRVYIPFGTEWYPYLMRRLAERPANVLFIAKNILRG